MRGRTFQCPAAEKSDLRGITEHWNVRPLACYRSFVNAAIIIPSRWASTRFPGKPLAMIAGRSLVQRVWERVAASARAAGAVYIATDDPRIFDHVESFRGKVVMTPEHCATGTDRVAIALNLIEEKEQNRFDQVVNVQGDEPLIDLRSVERVIETLQTATRPDIVTLACPIRDQDEFASRDVVKVVCDLEGNALYFSRAPIPHGARDRALRHIGLYGYQSEAIRRFVTLAPTPLEQAESLEQLRALQNGYKIRVLETSSPHLGVDRPEDVARIEKELAKTR